MKISDLAKQSDVPVSAVKYYQREGLLPDGVKTAPNQVTYDERHVRRVRLVRALLGVGGLSIIKTKEVIAALESVSLVEVFQVAQFAMNASRDNDLAPSATSRERIMNITTEYGWRITSDNPAVDVAARALDGFATIGFVVPEAYLLSYMEAAMSAANADLRALSSITAPEQMTELMIVGTVLGDPLFSGLRRLAQQSLAGHAFLITSKGDECEEY